MTLLLGLRERVEQPSLFAEFGPGGRRGPGVHLRRAARDRGREDEQVPRHQSDGAAGTVVRGRLADLRRLRERGLQEHWRGPEDVVGGRHEADGPSLVCRSLVALPHERGVPVAGARRFEIRRGARGRFTLCPESSRRAPRHRRDTCSMAWRCRFVTARWSQRGHGIADCTQHTGQFPHRCYGWAGLLWSTTTPSASRTPTSSPATTRRLPTCCARRASRSSTRRASRSRVPRLPRALYDAASIRTWCWSPTLARAVVARFLA